MTPNQMWEAIQDAEAAVEEAQRKYLDKSGWESTCTTLGSYWLHEKTFPDGRHYLCCKSDAITAQRHADLAEMDKPHAVTDDGKGFCTICGAEAARHDHQE